MTIDQEMTLMSRGCAEFIGNDEVRAKLVSGMRPVRIKCGFDPTTRKAHIGHMVQLLKLRDFQNLGHRVFLLVGTFTATIGDPTGKLNTRQALAADEVRENADILLAQLTRFLIPEQTVVVYNDEWLGEMSLAELVSWSRVLNVNELAQRRDFRQRIEDGTGLTLGELLYPVLQGYDSVQLRPDIELGGADQLLNCMFGRNMMSLLKMAPQAVLTMPLLPGLDGSAKMGKTEGNTIDISAPAEEIYGKVMSIRDELMPAYYRLLTRIPEDELAAIDTALESHSINPMETKKRLAREIVTLLCGFDDGVRAGKHFASVVQRKDFSDSHVPVTSLSEILNSQPSIGIVDLLVATGLAPSRSAARRLIGQGGVRLNGEKVGQDYTITQQQVPLEMRAGKRRALRLQ